MPQDKPTNTTLDQSHFVVLFSALFTSINSHGTTSGRLRSTDTDIPHGSVLARASRVCAAQVAARPATAKGRERPFGGLAADRLGAWRTSTSCPTGWGPGAGFGQAADPEEAHVECWGIPGPMCTACAQDTHTGGPTCTRCSHVPPSIGHPVSSGALRALTQAGPQGTSAGT